MQAVLMTVVSISLALHVLMAVVCLWRVGRGDSAFDRLLALDLISMLTLAVLVLMSILKRQSIYIDVALGLVALSYIVTIAMAKYIADQKVY